ncbi:MAG: hydrogenase small subunit [Chitinivibrionales bacterium]|nr:hydrogenase small subunit [Chitinivibrionales bacterium]
MGGFGAALAFPNVLFQGCRKALYKAGKQTPVIWLQGQSCSGCSISLLNSIDPDIASVITAHISLNFHQTVSFGTGDAAVRVIHKAVQDKRDDFVLVVEGSIPAKSDLYCTLGQINGHHKGIREWIEQLGSQAKAVIAIGTCATYGGIPAAEIRATGDNPTGATSLSEILPHRQVINVPGCPPHPDWMVGTLVQVVLKRRPGLDQYGRPLLYFSETVHDNCERLKYYKQNKFAEHWGDEGCLYKLGCLGIDTHCDIPKRKWVGGVNSCTGSGSGCIGCTEPVFPDTGKRGLYEHRKG